MKWYNYPMPRKKTGRPVGRPPHVPTDANRQTAQSLAAFGLPHLEIAGELNISLETLLKHYRIELDRGLQRANARVAQSLFNRATNETDKGGVTAAIFWLKCRAGWREAAQQVVTYNRNIDNMNEAELLALLGERSSADPTGSKTGSGGAPAPD